MIEKIPVRRGCHVTAALLALGTFACATFAQTVAKPNIYVQHNLVSDFAGKADVTDPNLVNPWGVSQTSSSPFWISDHDTGVTTLYNGSGAIISLVVKLPAAGGSTATGTPTGQVAVNGAAGWLLANGKPSSFIFATEDGTISAWNGGTAATVMVDNSSSGAVYKGLAINTTASNLALYAANFHAGTIDVFDSKFAPVTPSGGFTDPNPPSGFAPFNISNQGGKLYVMYAKQDAAKKNDVSGLGNGFVNVFDLTGKFLQRLVSNSVLNSPWGVAIAPANWGAFGGDVLVGNFGDGLIHAFDPSTGLLLGALQDATGNALVNQGLWALLFGNGKTGGDKNILYFTAEPSFGDTKVHGLFGAISPPQQILSISNAASQAIATAIAPGEVVVISGFTLGPSPLASLAIPATGSQGITVGSTSVTFNGTPAPILYASASGTAVIVPYALAGSASANVVVTFKNQPTAAFTIPVALSAPGLFTLDTSGSGQLVAFNQDGTLNGATNPAAAGSAVLLFATGEGQTNPPGQDGVVTGEFLREPIAKVSATIGGQSAQVIYAGSAIGSIAGIMQVELLVPAGTASGPEAVVLTVGSASSQANVTIAVK